MHCRSSEIRSSDLKVYGSNEILDLRNLEDKIDPNNRKFLYRARSQNSITRNEEHNKYGDRRTINLERAAKRLYSPANVPRTPTKPSCIPRSQSVDQRFRKSMTHETISKNRCSEEKDKPRDSFKSNNLDAEKSGNLGSPKNETRKQSDLLNKNQEQGFAVAEKIVCSYSIQTEQSSVCLSNSVFEDCLKASSISIPLLSQETEAEPLLCTSCSASFKPTKPYTFDDLTDICDYSVINAITEKQLFKRRKYFIYELLGMLCGILFVAFIAWWIFKLYPLYTTKMFKLKTTKRERRSILYYVKCICSKTYNYLTTPKVKSTNSWLSPKIF